ncbi:MAG: hypothetical protein EHM81_06080 [Chloroflexi bacterium]|nr:MAG: hypothetical protein EHM81_06080 [Chloroflexota bacterium]
MMENPVPASDFPSQPAEPKKNRTGLIIGIVVVVLCCCCLVFGGLGYWLWTNGDQLLQQIGMAASLL